MNRIESGLIPKEAIYSTEKIRDIPKVGLVGLPSSGKEVSARILREGYGFETFTLSQVIHNYLNLNQAEEGVFDRSILLDTGRSLKGRFGEPILTDLSLRTLMMNHDSKMPLNGFALDGFRTLGETQYIHQLPNSVLIALTAEPDLRLQRMITRGRAGDLTVDTFPEWDAVEQELFKPLQKIADYTYDNSGSLADLAGFIHGIMSERFGLNPHE